MEEQTLEQISPKKESSSSLSIRGIFEVFYKPVEFFKELKESPKILVPYLVLFSIVAISMFLLSDLIVQMQLESPQLQKQLEAAGQTSIPPQQVEIMKMFTLIGGTLAMALYPLLVAALALFFGNFVLGGKGSFRHLLSVSLYGAILFSLAGMVVVPLMLSKGTLMVTFSLGVLAADAGFDSVLFTALSKISIFHIWEIIVAGIGFSIIYEFNRNKGITLAVLSIGLLSAIHVLMTAIGKMFS